MRSTRSTSIRLSSRLIIVLLIMAFVIAGGLLLRSPSPALAFKPTGYWRATDGDKTHTQLTEEAIRELILDEEIIPGVTKITRSMKKAIDEIKEGNSGTDLSGDYFVDEAHFTGERLAGGQARLYSRLITIRSSLRDNKVGPARKALGQSLHAIQDFYAHSNWVELGHTGINADIGDFSRTAPLLAGAAGPNQTTCANCEPENCLSCVNDIITGNLTTAYFQAIPDQGLKPAGKCSHGGSNFDLSQDDPATGGINKDTADCNVSPHNYFHFVAASIAKQHTKAYIRYIKKNLSLRQFKSLLGVGNTLGFAIDTTGSMAEEIAGVKMGANAIVDVRLDTLIEPSKYVLVEINDPYAIVDSDTSNPDEFKQAINGLGASAGGDCPELAFMAILQALERFDEAGGELLVFTDATVKDGSLAGAVVSLAQQRNVKITMMLSGSCSPIDPDYYRISRETGGQSFVISESDAFEATKLADFAVRPDSVDIAHINANLSATPATYTVPVDSTLTSVTFAVSGSASTTITRPNGNVVQVTDPGVQSANISGGKVLSIANPTAGTWSITVQGDGEFTIRVLGESPLQFSSFDAVEPHGLPGHEGYQAIAGQPIAGGISKLAAELSPGTVNSETFQLRSAAGAVIQTLTLNEIPNSENSGSHAYFGEATLTNTPAMPYVTGTDSNGQTFQRVIPELIKPQTVKISAPLLKQIHPNRESAFNVQVTNYGVSGTFELNATDENNFVTYISPTAFTLATNESVDITVNVKAPANITGSIVDNLTLTVVSTGTTETKNSALTQLAVEPELELGPNSVLGGEPSIGTVRLFNGPAPPTGAVVTLTSSNPTIASVPASVAVPYGRTDESFVVSTSTVTQITPVTISASYGTVSLETVLQVAPAANSLISVEGSPSALKGGDRSNGIVLLNGPAPVGGANITLSSNLQVATVPASVTIPEGASSATFSIATTSVTASTTATISAVYNGLTRTASLKVNPTALESISVGPGDVAGGSYASVTVTLRAPAPTGGVQVALESGNTSIVTVPAQVTIPAGQSSATFLNSVATTSPAVPTTVGVRALYEGIVTAGYVRVTPSSVPANLYFAPSKLAGGQSSLGTVEMNQPAPPGGTVVTLSAGDTNIVTVPASVTVPEGTMSASFTLSTSTVTATTNVIMAASANGVGRTESITILPTSIQSLTLTPGSIGAGNTSTGQVTMSNPAPTGGALISLKSSDTAVATVPATVTVAEGATTATFAVNTAAVELSSNPAISASYAGDTRTATLRVFGANDVFSTIVPNGPPVTITTTTAGQNARLVFEGTAGQRVSLKMSNVTISSSNVAILNIDGANLTNNIFVGTGGAFLDVTTLPSTGTYTILIDPNGSAVGSMTLQLYDVPADVSASIAANATPVTVTNTVPGQNAYVSFTGVSGQRISLKITGVVMTDNGYVDVTIKKPDGSVLASAMFITASGAFIDTQSLPVSGTYVILVNPQGFSTGNVTLTLYDVPADISGTIVPGGSSVTVTTTVPGQNGLLSFSGLANQRITLNVGPVTTSGGSGYVDVVIKKPDGSQLAAAPFISSSGGFIDAQTLPVTGTYTILVDPQSSTTVGATLTLNDVSSDIISTITAAGSPVTITTTSVGQNALVSFEGNSGQRISLTISNVGLSGGNGYVDVYIKKPDGTTLTSSIFITSNGGFIDVSTLPVSGTYTILVDPQGSNTGSVTLTLYEVPADITGPITAGGSAVTITTTTPGQNAQLTFNGTAGQRVAMQLSNSTFPGCLALINSIKKADGTTLISAALCSATGFIDTVTLPVTGTYTILIDPQAAKVGSVSLTLFDVPADVTASITPGGAPLTLTTTSIGQNARASFTGSANQRISLKVAGVSLTGGDHNWVTVSILKPDGAILTSSIFDSAGGFIDVKTLPVAGTYTVLIDPWETTTGSVTVTLYDVPPDVSVSITPGGPPVTLTNTTPGQNAQATFTATANQRVSLNTTNVALTGGSHNWVYVAIQKPDGSTLTSSLYDTGSTGFIDLQTLAAAGTYAISVDPWDSATGSVTITLNDVPADASGTMTVGGAALTLTTTVAGQNAIATFNGTADQQVFVAFTGNTMGTITATLLKPDGTTLTSLTSSAGSFSFPTQSLPVTGTYSVMINSGGPNVGSITVSVSEVTSSATLQADYQFQNTRSSSVGSPPALADLGTNSFTSATVDGTSTTVLTFSQNNGLSLSSTSGVIPNNTYSIVMLFSIQQTSGYRRLLDFKNGSSDNGLYSQNGHLYFYPAGFGNPVSIVANTWVQLVVTRDTTGTVTGYIDGVQQFQFADTSSLGVIDTNNVLRFFRDDNTASEASAGSVVRIRLYNGALTSAQVAALSRLP